jgi:hypothetical protein
MTELLLVYVSSVTKSEAAKRRGIAAEVATASFFPEKQ